MVMAADTAQPNRPGVIGRLAPSPTGVLHLGNARTFLLAWLSVRSRGSGLSIWRYDFVETETADTRTASRVGAALSRIFGGPSVSSPVNVAYSNEIRHRLTVFIGPDDVVRDYEYERTERPSKRVY